MYEGKYAPPACHQCGDAALFSVYLALLCGYDSKCHGVRRMDQAGGVWLHPLRRGTERIIISVRRAGGSHRVLRIFVPAFPDEDRFLSFSAGAKKRPLLDGDGQQLFGVCGFAPGCLRGRSGDRRRAWLCYFGIAGVPVLSCSLQHAGVRFRLFYGSPRHDHDGTHRGGDSRNGGVYHLGANDHKIYVH